MVSIIKAIEEDMVRPTSTIQEQTSKKQNIFSLTKANDILEAASKRPDPKPLYKPFWNEGELCCLFADSNVGKSILAVQIGEEIANNGKKVVYLDLEMSDKQFQRRYTSDNNELYHFSDNFYRMNIDNTRLINSELSEDSLLSQIKETVRENGIGIIIIDNISWLCNKSEKGEDAGKFMQQLMKLKLSYGWSVLILAHTPKRPLNNPITQNDLAGSKKLFNFFDSAFTIGKSCKGIDVRYIKQLKVRDGMEQYGANNVLTCKIVKDGSYIHFEEIGTSEEKEHLGKPYQIKNSEVKEKVKALSEDGKSIRDISEETGVSKSTVQRWLAK